MTVALLVVSQLQALRVQVLDASEAVRGDLGTQVVTATPAAPEARLAASPAGDPFGDGDPCFCYTGWQCTTLDNISLEGCSGSAESCTCEDGSTYLDFTGTCSDGSLRIVNTCRGY
jgi:hypothetical protein